MSSQKNKKEIQIKLALLGRDFSGKSSMIERFVYNKYPVEHDIDVEDSHKISISLEDYQIELEILDTAGEDDYPSMLEMWINWA